MTRSRLLAGVAALLLGAACGRLGPPVRAAAVSATPARDEASAIDVQAPASPVDEDGEEKKK